MADIKENPSLPICMFCKNFIPTYNEMKCKAFKEIPNEILSGDNDHSKPLPNQDNDIVFESI